MRDPTVNSKQLLSEGAFPGEFGFKSKSAHERYAGLDFGSGLRQLLRCFYPSTSFYGHGCDSMSVAAVSWGSLNQESGQVYDLVMQ